MSNQLLKYHPLAVEEILAAVRWYLDRDVNVARRFDEQLRQVELRVLEHPEMWGPYLHGTRCCKLTGFPYGLIYQQRPDYLLGIAVAHLHRKPGYWRARVVSPGGH